MRNTVLFLLLMSLSAVGGCSQKDLMGTGIDVLRAPSVEKVSKKRELYALMRKVTRNVDLPPSATEISMCTICFMDCTCLLVFRIEDKNELAPFLQEMTGKPIAEFRDKPDKADLSAYQKFRTPDSTIPYDFDPVEGALKIRNGRYLLGDGYRVAIDMDSRTIFIDNWLAK